MKRVLHLVRTGEPPALADGDWVVYLDPEPRLSPHGQPPETLGSPGPITHDQLVAAIFAADLVVTW